MGNKDKLTWVVIVTTLSGVIHYQWVGSGQREDAEQYYKDQHKTCTAVFHICDSKEKFQESRKLGKIRWMRNFREIDY